MTTLKYENFADVGDRIRSYDFKPMLTRGECYVEGVVLAKGYHPTEQFKCFTIECERDVVEGKPSLRRVGEVIYVPMQVAMMEYTGRVVKLTVSTTIRAFTEDEQQVMDWGLIHEKVEPANDKARRTCYDLCKDGLMEIERDDHPFLIFVITDKGKQRLMQFYKTDPTRQGLNGGRPNNESRIQRETLYEDFD